MLAVAAEPYESDASRVPEHILRHKHSQKLAQQCWAQQLEQQSIDTEAGMLSGISQKHNMRSSPCRFTEFCNSQCLLHFAAPFIVDRTETFITENYILSHETLRMFECKVRLRLSDDGARASMLNTSYPVQHP